MVSRETTIVVSIGIFIVIMGAVAAFVIMAQTEPEVLDEQMWFRIESITVDGLPLNSTTSLITICDALGNFEENIMYVNNGDWQSSSKAYELGLIIRFVIFFYEGGDYYDATYRIGRGAINVQMGSYYIEFTSYWEKPTF